jgi:hypothetical protein
MGEAQHAVEIRAADPDAAVGQDVVGALRCARSFGRYPHDGKIGGAAADIGDQGEFFAFRLLLEMQRRRNRFVLEGYIGEAGGTRCLLQVVLRPSVRRLVAVDEVHRPAEHHVGQFVLPDLFRHRFDVPEKDGEDRREGDAPPLDPGVFLEQAGTENALECPHEASAFAVDIALPRLAPERHGPMGMAEEDRARNGRTLSFQRCQHGTVAGRERQRAVGSAEVETAAFEGAERGRRHRFRSRSGGWPAIILSSGIFPDSGIGLCARLPTGGKSVKVHAQLTLRLGATWSAAMAAGMDDVRASIRPAGGSAD